MAEIKRQDIGGVNEQISIPRAQAGGGLDTRGLESSMAEITNWMDRKRDIQDTIDANELLAEHSIEANRLQSETLKSDLRDDELISIYGNKLEQVNQGILKKARSENVRNLLAQQLPSRSAARLGQIQEESDKRFTASALAGYDRSLQLNTRAYASAKTPEERMEIRTRHQNAINILARMGVFDATHKQNETSRFQRSVELFDIEQAIQSNPDAGMEAITDPAKFLKKYPNVKIDDLENVFAKSVQLEDRQRTLFDRRKKEAREAVISTVDEAVIRGKIDFDQLNQLRDRGLLAPEDYRRSAAAIQKLDEEGGQDDPSVKGDIETRIRLNPFSVGTPEIIGAFNQKRLSRKGMNEVLDLRSTWQRAQESDARSAAAEGRAASEAKIDPRLKGPLFADGKQKIDQIVGKGLTISGINVDADTRRRWGAASDEYLQQVVNEPNRSHADIANEIITRYQGPAKAAEIAPQIYRNTKAARGVDFQRILKDFDAEKDPKKKNELRALIKKLQETKE